MARGSLEEVKYQILLSKDLGYIKGEQYDNITMLTNEVGKMLNALINKLKAN
jgi:four helix bundle protein